MVQESKIKTIDARSKNFKLVGGLEHFLFSVIYGIILPIDELIFFKMVKTTNQMAMVFLLKTHRSWPPSMWRLTTANASARIGAFSIVR